jgi:hypothetical protein
LADVDVERLLASHGGVEATGRWMIASLPTVFITDPPVGPCFTTAGLAKWRQVSRQAIFQGRRAGRLLGFKHDGVLVYPDVQFGPDGKPLPAVRELLATAPMPLTDAAAVAEWLRTPIDGSGNTPVEILEASRAADAEDRLRRPELYHPRMIDPRGLESLSPKRTPRP